MNSKGLIVLGFILTALFFWACYVLSTQVICTVIDGAEDCSSNFERFLQSPPNEKGDTLAGLAGSLAFLWIIITVLMQGRELSLQREELERMRGTQEEQTRLLLAENNRQSQLSIDEKIRAMVEILMSTLPSLGFREFTVADTSTGNVNKVFFVNEPTGALMKEYLSVRPNVWADRISKTHNAVTKYCTERSSTVVSPARPIPWLACLTQADSIIREANEGASPAVVEWVFHDLKLPYLKRVLSEALDDDVIWAPVLEKQSDK